MGNTTTRRHDEHDDVLNLQLAGADDGAGRWPALARAQARAFISPQMQFLSRLRVFASSGTVRQAVGAVSA